MAIVLLALNGLSQRAMMIAVADVRQGNSGNSMGLAEEVYEM